MIIKDFIMVSHMALSKEHLHKYVGIIEANDHILNGVKIAKEVLVPKYKRKWGEPDISWYIDQDNSPMFNTLPELIKHYNLPELTQQKK